MTLCTIIIRVCWSGPAVLGLLKYPNNPNSNFQKDTLYMSCFRVISELPIIRQTEHPYIHTGIIKLKIKSLTFEL